MRIEPTEEQAMLRDSVMRFCRNEAPMTKIREWMESPEGFDRNIWMNIAGQSWLGVLVPEEHGGLGLGVVELGIILEEMGRTLFPGPFFSSAALAAPVIRDGAREGIKQHWLEAMATGQKIATVALLEEDARLGARFVRTRTVRNGSGYILSGSKFFVPDLPNADAAIVAARTGSGDRDISLFLVETTGPGVSVHSNKVQDETMRSGQLVMQDAFVPQENLIGSEGEGWPAAERILQIAAVGLAAASVAGAEQVLQTIVAYAKERKQFGVPIGTFQAIKHPLADLFAEIESARSAYHYASWAVGTSHPDAGVASAVARMTATEAFYRAALVSLQAHGGIGFTWEYDLHLYLKRALHNRNFLGPAKYYEDIVAEAALNLD